MPNGYRKVTVEKPYFSWREEGGAETGNKFNKPNKNRKYIKILALCLTYAPAKLIYPNTKQPLMHQVRDMCRAGLLERYQRAGDRKYYYKTTSKGADLLIQALETKN
jgi:hypothetical protein